MIPRRTITFYPKMGRDVIRTLARPGGAHRVRAFEDAFARYIGTGHALSTCSGTDAMLLILDALGLQRGDHLLSTAYTIRPLVQTLLARGFDLELLDISTEDFNVSVDDLRRKVRNRTKAVIVTHMFGVPARMDAIKAALSGHGCTLIEDAAHAHGAKYGGRRCGSLADAAFFSFDQVKPVSTFGGGMVVTDDDGLAEEMRRRLTGAPIPTRRLSNVVMGYAEHAVVNSPLFSGVVWLTRKDRLRSKIGALYRLLDRRPAERNLRLSAMQADLGLRQLEHLDGRLALRRRTAAHLAKHCRGLTPQKVPEGAEPSYHKFTALAPKESSYVKEMFFHRGIDVGIKGDVNYPCYVELGQSSAGFPGTRFVYQRLVELPAYETLSARAIDRIASAIGEIR